MAERTQFAVRSDTELEAALDVISKHLAASSARGLTITRSDAVRHAIFVTAERLLAESEGKTEPKGKAK